MDVFIEGLMTLLLLPLQLVLTPLDALLNTIPDIDQIPDAINAVVNIVGSIPETLVSIFGIAPFLWNALFLIFILYIGAAPAINGIKKVWAWIRP